MNRDRRRAEPPSRRAADGQAGDVLRGWRRPLAGDDVRAQFWVRHLRIGVGLTMATSALLALYATAVPDRPHPGLIAGLSTVAFTASPLLLRLPMRQMAQDHRGWAFFYGWSVVITLMIAAASAVDGGATSLLVLLFCLTLSFAAVAYPPRGVAALGAFMVVTHVVVAAGGPSVLDTEAAVPAGVLAVFVVMATCTSHNQWESHAQGLLLARTLEIEATTDSLTGCLNRRAFLQRLGSATRAAERPDAGAAGRPDARRDGRPDALAERRRDAVARQGLGLGVTASVGVTISEPGDDAQTLLRRADRAMYRAKSAGGNRVV